MSALAKRISAAIYRRAAWHAAYGPAASSVAAVTATAARVRTLLIVVMGYLLCVDNILVQTPSKCVPGPLLAAEVLLLRRAAVADELGSSL